jgi:hypothetical protein
MIPLPVVFPDRDIRQQNRGTSVGMVVSVGYWSEGLPVDSRKDPKHGYRASVLRNK